MTLSLRAGERLAVAVVTAVAAAAFFGNVSGGLVPGEGLSAASSCLFGSGRFAPTVWSALLTSVWSLTDGCATAVRLGLVSAFSGTVAAGAFAFVLCRALSVVVVGETMQGVSCGLPFRRFPVVCAGVGGLAFAFTPGVFAAATHAGPLTTVLALTIMSFALILSCVGSPVGPVGRFFRFGVAGACAGAAALEGTFGLVVAPFSLACAFVPATMGKHRPTLFVNGYLIGGVVAAAAVLAACGGLPVVRLEWLPVYLHLLCLAFLPPLLFCGLMSRRGSNEGWVPVVAGWAAAVAVAALICRSDRATGLGPDAYVQGVVRELGDRRWIVSDGPLDDLLLFRKPAGARLLSLAREADLDYGQELAAVVRQEIPDADDELLTAAEIGPAQFLGVWLRRDEGATNCVFATLLQPVEVRDLRAVRPCAYCWRPEASPYDPVEADTAWRAAWREISPLLKGGGAWKETLGRRFAVQGNAISSRLQDAGHNEAAWKAYSLARQDMDGQNLSVLVNMADMGRRGFAGSASSLERLTDELKTLIGDLSNRREMRLKLAEGGGIFISRELRAELQRRLKAARLDAWNSPAGRLVHEGFGKLQEIAALKGEERKRALDRGSASGRVR